MFHKVGLLWGVAVLALAVASGAAGGDEKPRPVDVCADFTLFPDNHKFPDQFTYAAFKFKKQPRSGTLLTIRSKFGIREKDCCCKPRGDSELFTLRRRTTARPLKFWKTLSERARCQEMIPDQVPKSGSDA